MNRPLFISCYTTDDLYRESTRRLRNSLLKYELDFEIQPYESMGSWKANTFHKPVFIREIMGKHPTRSLVWLDADAEVVDFPELFFKIQADIAAGFKGNEFLSGTLYFKNEPKVRALVNIWIQELSRDTERFPSCREQIALSEIIRVAEKEKLLVFEPLPFEYVKIFDVPHDKAPVILHHQISRQGKQLYAA
jgi:hypothetical protein